MSQKGYVAFFLSFFIISVCVSSQDEVTIEKIVPERFVERLKKMEAALGINDLTLNIKAGFDGKLVTRDDRDEMNPTRTLDSQKLSLTGLVSYGVYPTEAEFSASIFFEYLHDDIGQSEKFQESMTKFMTSFEHYFDKTWEGYLFVERFSNTYLGVEQRWEVGGGVKAEFDFLSKKRQEEWNKISCNQDIADFLNQLLKILDGDQGAHFCGNGQQDGQTEKMLAQLLIKKGFLKKSGKELTRLKSKIYQYLDLIENFKKEENKLAITWKKQKANVQFDLASTLLVDTTSPSSLKYTLLKLDDKLETLDRIPQTVSFEPLSKMRLALRGALVFRPMDDMQLSTKCYIKIPLNKSYIDYNGQSIWDWRLDSFTKIEYKIPLGSGNNKITVGIQLDTYFDNITPFLSDRDREKILADITLSPEDIAKGVSYKIMNFKAPNSYYALFAQVGWEL